MTEYLSVSTQSCGRTWLDFFATWIALVLGYAIYGLTFTDGLGPEFIQSTFDLFWGLLIAHMAWPGR